jgi:organic radical activating enzyme
MGLQDKSAAYIDSRKASYTAASVLPLKVIQSKEIQAAATLKRYFPVHAQFIPTERCNLNCSWCSCANDTRRITASIEMVEKLVDVLSRWGCRAVTITGGGEPLMAPDIKQILTLFNGANIKIGLVSNGYLFPSRTDTEDISKLTWCRISCSDDRGLDTKGFGDAITYAVERGPNVDWAFSYVVTREFNLDRFCEYIEYANKYDFTHMRAVSDLFDLDGVIDMDIIKRDVRERGINDSKVIYQGRKEFSRGVKDCLISLLKPVIGADGKIYPCCGAQYALDEPTRNMPDELCMGTIDDLDEIFAKQLNFDGSICRRCYYGDYNKALSGLIVPLEHREFV